MALGRLTRHDVEATLRADDLSVPQVSALGHLAADPGTSYSELARRAGVTAQSMQATLQQLERRGAVHKRTPSGRGRTAQLHLSPIGEQLLQRGQLAITQAGRHLLVELTQDEQVQLAGLLLRVFTATLTPDVAPVQRQQAQQQTDRSAEKSSRRRDE